MGLVDIVRANGQLHRPLDFHGDPVALIVDSAAGLRHKGQVEVLLPFERLRHAAKVINRIFKSDSPALLHGRGNSLTGCPEWDSLAGLVDGVPDDLSGWEVT